MMTMRRCVLFLALLIVLSAPRPTLGADSVPADQFDPLVKLIKPTAAESTWSSIPWMSDINAARKKAAAEGKPLFVWTTASEPLGGC
jgi:hypothetical protein